MVIDFAPFHLGMMRLTPERVAEAERYLEALVALGRAGWVRTLVDDKPEEVQILGVAGVVPCGGDVGEVFVIKAEGAPRMEFVKDVKKLVDQARGHFATIRALGEEGDARVERWLSWLGFRVVGVEASRVVPGKRMILWEIA